MRRYGVVMKLLAAAAVATASAPAPDLPLALCEDIEVIDTKVLTKPPKRGDEPLPELLMDFLNTYAGEHPDTYAGTWISGAISRKWRHVWGGAVVLAFTDDPKPHLAAIRRRRPRETDWPVDVVRAPYTESELEAVRTRLFEMFERPDPYYEDEITRNNAKLAYYEAKLRACQSDSADAARYQAKVDKYRGAGDPLRQLRTKFVGFSARRDSQLSRVRIIFSLPGLLSPPEPTVEDVAAMAEALPDEFQGKVCAQGPRWLDDRLQARFAPMADAGADPLVDCDGSPLAPLSTFTGEPDVPAGSNDPLHVLLHGLGPAEGWRTLARDGKRASFYWTDGDNYRVRTYEMTWRGWRMAGDTSGVGECDLEVTRLALPKGLGYVQMSLDHHNPPDPESTTLHLLVSQEGCASGMSGVERMPKPEVIESATEIRIAMGVISGGGGTCPSNRFDPIKIDLAAPIGGRKIFDGLFLLPRPLKLPEMPPRVCARAAEGVEDALFRADRVSGRPRREGPSGRRVVIAAEAPGGRPTTREEYEAWFEQVESLVDARCTGCAFCSWDGENYSECRPSTFEKHTQDITRLRRRAQRGKLLGKRRHRRAQLVAPKRAVARHPQYTHVVRHPEHEVAPLPVADLHLALDLGEVAVRALHQWRELPLVPPRPQTFNFEQSRFARRAVDDETVRRRAVLARSIGPEARGRDVVARLPRVGFDGSALVALPELDRRAAEFRPRDLARLPLQHVVAR